MGGRFISHYPISVHLNTNANRNVMHAYIPTKSDLEKIVDRAVKKAVQESLPSAIRKGTRKQWLRTSEVMEILNLSRRSIQNLRDSKKLPYSQNGRKILYNIDEVLAYLDRGKVNYPQ